VFAAPPSWDRHPQTFTIEDVQQFEKRHPISTKVRLALALLMFTGSAAVMSFDSASNT
jgi:hypothetical protein